MIEKNCPILGLYSFMGKKWSYPIISHMKKDEAYPFETMIYITDRKISRSLLLNFLKEAIALKLLYKSDKGYALTEYGKDLKSEIGDFNSIISRHNDFEKNCKDDCPVNRNRL